MKIVQFSQAALFAPKLIRIIVQPIVHTLFIALLTFPFLAHYAIVVEVAAQIVKLYIQSNSEKNESASYDR